MSRDTERRAARLAESRFGLTPDLVRPILREVLRAQAGGISINLLAALLDRQLLTARQAAELSRLLQESRTPPADEETPAGAQPREASLTATDPLTPGRAEWQRDSHPMPLRLGNYRILRKLGEGGMCAVYLANEVDTQQQVAVKVLPVKLAIHQPTLDRFYREARSGSLLDHPNIVRNLGVGQDQLTLQHYLVMEFIDGFSAQALLEHFGRVPLPEAIRIVLDVAHGLEYAHSRNVIHRDIKPDNILITRQGVVKLSDLGLAKRLDDASHLTGTRQGFGTPHYVPYEQAINARNADGRSDIYALGATLYHLVTGAVPFRANSQVEVVEKKKQGHYPAPRQINPDVPEVLERILRRMLAADPRERYQTVRDLIADLELTNLAAPPQQAIGQLLTHLHAEDAEASDSQPTARDLRAPSSNGQSSEGTSGLWYLRYRDPAGQWCKTRATASQVRQRLADGKLPANAQAARSLQGAFQPLTSYPELTSAQTPPEPWFPEALELPEPGWRWFRANGRPSWCLYVALGLLLAILTTLGVALGVLINGG